MRIFLQARYRQYFEEDLAAAAAADPNNDAEAMIPMETQVLMQEVLTDGMAFCSLMWSGKTHLRLILKIYFYELCTRRSLKPTTEKCDTFENQDFPLLQF